MGDKNVVDGVGDWDRIESSEGKALGDGTW